ncbi:MAG TPA: hypothetical protein VIP09_01870, partial [Dehalococcoidia bacterium]
MSGRRHKGRILALQAMFEMDAVGHPPEHSIDVLLEGLDPSPEVRRFALELVEGVLASRERI